MIDTPNNEFQSSGQPVQLPPLTSHPLYHQVHALIDRGNWGAAQAPLAELLNLYPDDEYLKELAVSVRTRSALLGDDEELVVVSTRNRPHILRLTLLGLAALMLLCGITAGGVLAWKWIAPQLQNQRQAARVAELQEEAQNALTSGDYDRAVLAYNSILEIEPDNEQALRGLEQAYQLRTTASIYSEAIIEMEAHHWENALALFQQIEAEQPNYRDVGQRIGFVQTQQTLVKLYQDAEAAFGQGNYELAVQKYEELRATDYGFEEDVVKDHLFLSYLQLGLAQEAAAGSDVEALQQALNLLDKALALRPNDSQTKGESQLIKLYLSGLKEFEAKNWPQAVADLSTVYEARPDFADGTASEFLYEAYVTWADELYQNEQFEEALALYEAAAVVKGADIAALNSKMALAEEAMIPPTPTPTPTAVPTSRPIPVAGSGGGGPAPAPTPENQTYQVKIMKVRNNCSGSGYIHGVVWNAYNMPMPGVTVQAFNTSTGAGPLTSNPTDGDGVYQIILNGDQIAGLWMVQILDDGGTPASEAWGQYLGGECVNGAQELKVDWQRGLLVQN